MTDSAEYVPPKVWTWDQPSGGQFANINRPVAGPTHDERAAGRQAPVPALFPRDPQRAEGRRSCSRSCSSRATADAEYDAWPIRIGEGDQFSQRLCRHQSQFENPGAARPQRPRADPRVRIRRDPRSPRREVRRVPARLRPGARRNPVVAVLADGHRALPRRRLRPFLRLRAGEIRISDQPLRDGGQAPVRRAQPPARPRTNMSPAPITRSPTSRSGPGTAASRSAAPIPAPTSSSRPTNMSIWCAGRSRSTQRPAVKRGRIVNKLTGDHDEQLHERHDASDFELRTRGQDRWPRRRGRAVKDDAI